MQGIANQCDRPYKYELQNEKPDLHSTFSLDFGHSTLALYRSLNYLGNH